jgi:hypothetical protein
MGNPEATPPKADPAEVQRKQSRMFLTRGLGWSFASGLTVAFGTPVGDLWAAATVGLGFATAALALLQRKIWQQQQTTMTVATR